MYKTKINFLLILSVIISISFFTRCDKIGDDIIEPEFNEINVSRVLAPVVFKYTPQDSTFNVSIEVNQPETISEVTSRIITSRGDEEVKPPRNLTRNGFSFSGSFTLGKSIPSGNYQIEFFITNVSGFSNKAAVHNFEFDNGKANIPPVISDLQAPAKITAEEPKTVFPMFLTVSDSNGLSDIQSVYFITYRADGTTNNNKTFLFDDGDFTRHGDEYPYDGRYSVLLEITPANRGRFRLEFRAQDKGKKLSNTIVHNIEIQ